MNTFKIFMSSLCMALLISCSDYLEKPLLSNQVTQETVFSDRLTAEAFLYQAYRMTLPWGFPYTDREYKFEESRSVEEAMCQSLEAHYNSASCVANNVNDKGYVAADRRTTNDTFLTNWEGIRHCYLFIDGIGQVPNIPKAEKQQMIAECKTMIALRYVEMLKHYGGVPIVREVLSGNTEGLGEIRRASIEEMINFIVEYCDESAEVLPNSYPSQLTGRITKGAALSVKAEALLFAASPLFNSSQTILPYDHPEYISYGSFDANRWKLAADASKAVIDWAKANGKDIIDTNNPFDDFGRAVSEQDNQEVILAYKGRYDSQDDDGFYKYYVPISNGFYFLYNALPYFYKEDGTNQAWPQVGGPAEPYSEFISKMEEMEPRFKQTVWVFGTQAYNNPNNNSFQWNYNRESGNPNQRKTGVGKMIKFLYNYQGEEFKEWMIYRTAEFYLNYAEALVEFDYASGKTEALNALNVIRNRAGIPEVDASDTRIATQEGMREIIRRERYCELFGEEHRVFDIRRWRIAENNEVGGPAYFFKFTQNASRNDYIDYQVFKYEDRIWTDRMYFTPFPEASAVDANDYFQNEVAKGYLDQNPGY